MKKCTYCGRENEDTAVNCGECGASDFKNVSEKLPPATEESPKPRSGGPTCKRCGAEYNTWTAPLHEVLVGWAIGAGLCHDGFCGCSRFGLCGACREAEKNKRAEEAAKHGDTPAAAVESNPAPLPNQEARFYYRAKDEEKGPFTYEQLKALWTNGQITADAMCRSADSMQRHAISQMFLMPTLPSTSKAEELSKLFELKKQGALSVEEFNQEKAKLLQLQVVVSASVSDNISPAMKAQINQYQQKKQQLKKLQKAGKTQFIIACLLIVWAVAFAALALIYASIAHFQRLDGAYPECENTLFLSITFGGIAAGSFIISLPILAILLMRGVKYRKAGKAEAAKVMEELTLVPEEIQSAATNSQSTQDHVPLAQEWQTAVQSGSAHLKGWYKKAAIAGGIALLAICGFALLKGVMGRTGSGGTSGGVTQSANKSGRQLIRDYAEARHGRNADVDIQSGFFGGAYQVTVSDHENFHTYTYAVEVDEKGQRVTAWQLTASH